MKWRRVMIARQRWHFHSMHPFHDPCPIPSSRICSHTFTRSANASCSDLAGAGCSLVEILDLFHTVIYHLLSHPWPRSSLAYASLKCSFCGLESQGPGSNCFVTTYNTQRPAKQPRSQTGASKVTWSHFPRTALARAHSSRRPPIALGFFLLFCPAPRPPMVVVDSDVTPESKLAATTTPGDTRPLSSPPQSRRPADPRH